MKPGNRIRLLIFLVIGGLAVVNAGARYAGLTDNLMSKNYTVNVALAKSGGLFPRGEVTYRGFTVGRVKELNFNTRGVTAVLSINKKWKIPADLTAEVHNRSAVGEQYLDLVPRTESAPYLEDGAEIATSNTTTPTDTQQLVVAADGLFRSIPTSDLGTVVNETSEAFVGSGDDIGGVLDNSRTILRYAQASLPDTLGLLRHGGTVLATQHDQADTIRGFLSDLADVTEVVSDNDGRLRLVLKDGTRGARELRKLADGLAPNLPLLLANTIQLAGILTARLPELEETLVAVPWALASAQTPGRDARAHFTFVGGTDPTPCTSGYIPANRWKSFHDPVPSVLSDSIGCLTPSSVPLGVVEAPSRWAY